MKIVFHIGFFKTATTFLENNIYIKQSNLNYINLKNKYEIEKILYFIKNSTSNEFRKNYKKFATLTKNLDWSENMTNIISAVGITDVLTQKNIHLDLLVILKRIKRIFNFNKNKIKILVTYRKQDSYILSRYAENRDYFIKVKKSWSSFYDLQKDIENVHLKKKTKEKTFFQSLKYSLILNKCVKIFGKNNVKFINYELLNKNSKLFLKNIFLFMEIKKFSYLNISPINKSKKNESYYYLKGPKIKKIIYRNLNNKDYLKKFFFRKLKFFTYICLKIFIFFLRRIFIENQINYDKNLIKKINIYYKIDNKKMSKLKSLIVR